MKMQLTDKELRESVHNYVRDVIGINLTGKKLAIAFSATRQEGIVTSLDITQDVTAIASLQLTAAPVSIPGYSDNTVDQTAVDAPAAAEPIADPGTPEVAAAAQAEQTLGDPVQEAATLVTAEEPVLVATSDPDADPVADSEPAVAETAPAPKTTATLFGKPSSATTAA